LQAKIPLLKENVIIQPKGDLIMNPVIETICNRRSVRSFSTRKIGEKEIDQIIRCGNFAPSGAASRMWRFVVVESDEFRGKLAELAKPRHDKWLSSMPEEARNKITAIRVSTGAPESDPVYYGAPVIIFVIGWGRTCDLDTPMVCQNMMLAARSMEIGSCWVYAGQLVLDDQEVRTKLELKDNEKVFGPILFGYPSKCFPEAGELKDPYVIKC
jgi:nitroreductase